MKELTKISKPFRNLKAIDGLRGFCALYVLVFHTLTINEDFLGPLFKNFINFGWSSVRLFFCVSGFLIVNSFSREKMNTRSFYRRRFFRIFPLWILVASVFSLIANTSWLNYFLNLTFLFGFFMHNSLFSPVPGAWSLFIEEVFYLIFPFVYGKRNHLIRLSFALFVCFVCWRLWKYFDLFNWFEMTNPDIKNFFILNHIHFIFIGCIVAEVLKTDRGRNTLGQISNSPFKYFFDLVSFPAFLSPVFGVHFPYNLELTVPLLMINCLIEGSLLNRILSFQPLVWAGKRCYGIYIWHFIIAISASKLVTEFFQKLYGLNHNENATLLCGLTLIMTLAVAEISWRLVEAPMIARGKK